ncbi:unnamed protein product [Allacma fusca]|uniref:Uncharacterized protein n=1 Tax=Allacma fusca TaxID=39272 RepID=A0A8J2K6W0_9HEXA|nr:unnamed protein product [Allacma fusca]
MPMDPARKGVLSPLLAQRKYCQMEESSNSSTSPELSIPTASKDNGSGPSLEVNKTPSVSLTLQLNNSSKDGLNYYKQLMAQLLEKKEPLTTSQIQIFHTQIKTAIIQAFEETYANVVSSDRKLSAEVAQAKQELEASIDSEELMSKNLTKYGNQIEDVVSQIQKCTHQAEEYYNEKISKFDTFQSSGKIITLKHTMLKFETLQKFQTLLQKKGLDMQAWCKKELEHKLESNLQELLLKESQEETAPSGVSESGKIISPGQSNEVPEAPSELPDSANLEYTEIPEDFSLLALPLNISIYIDTSVITVATADATPEIIKTFPARIAFSDDQILIGSKAKKCQDNVDNCFGIYEIIKQQQSTSHFIYLQNFCTTLCTEEILTLFFKSLEREVLRLKSSTTLGNVVITTAFTCIGKEKERLKFSAKMADWKNVRLLSSALTTAIAFSKQTQYFARKPTQRKLILVIQYLKDSFTMAVAEIEPKSISTKVSFGSVNLEECQSSDFLMNHALMREKGKDDVYSNVHSCYYKVGKFIQDFMKGGNIDRIIVVKDFRELTALDLMIQKMFGVRMEFVQVADGPILGGSSFASRDYQNPYLPKGVQVSDCFNTEFVIVYNEIVVDKISTRVMSEERLCCKINVVEGGSIRVLEKIFDGNFVEFSNFYLDASTEDETYEICLFEKIDEDGVYCIRVDIPKYVKGNVTRVDNLLLMMSDPFVGTRLDKLTQHYEEINAKSVKKEYYQLYFY